MHCRYGYKNNITFSVVSGCRGNVPRLHVMIGKLGSSLGVDQLTTFRIELNSHTCVKRAHCPTRLEVLSLRMSLLTGPVTNNHNIQPGAYQTFETQPPHHHTFNLTNIPSPAQQHSQWGYERCTSSCRAGSNCSVQTSLSPTLVCLATKQDKSA